MAGQKIGEMNGKWALMLKFALGAFWPIVAASSWWLWRIEDRVRQLETQAVVTEQYQESVERFTQTDGKILEMRIQQNAFGVQEISKDIDEIKTLVKDVQRMVRD